MLNCWLLIINDWQEILAFAGMTRYFDFWDSLIFVNTGFTFFLCKISKFHHLLFHIEDGKENTYFKYKSLKNKRDVVSNEYFFNTPQYIYFVEDFNNDIIVLKDKGIEKILSIDFGENSIFKDFLTILRTV
jgi:hypothetical protein